MFDGARQVEIDDPWLHHRAPVFQIQVEDLVHSSERDHDSATARESPTGKPGTGPAAHNGYVIFHGQFDDPRHFAGGGWKNHNLRPRPIHRAIIFIKRQIFRAG